MQLSEIDPRTKASFSSAVTSVEPAQHVQQTSESYDATIPVLNMSKFENQATRAEFVKDLENALHEVGFFAIINTHVDIEALNRAYKAAEEFFNLDFDTKMKARQLESVGIRGFVPGETAKGEARKDNKEFYHVGREAATEEQLKRSRNFPNVWPKEVNLKEPLTELFKALEKHMIPIQEAIAEALELPSNFFIERTKDGNVLLRALYYPANPPQDSIWGGAHTDINFFTILPRSTAEGLQVKNKQGDWITVKVPENSFIINAGDMLENMTNGYFRSAVHRVIDTGHHKARYSMVMFVHPRSNDDVSPLPQLVEKTGRIIKYPQVKEEEMLFERLGSLGYATVDQLKILSESGAVERMIKFDRASLATMKKLQENGLASDTVQKEITRLDKLPKSLNFDKQYI